MGVSVQVSNAKFYKQWVNDSSFASDLTNFTQNLAGNVMQKIKVVQDVAVSWETTTQGGVEWNIAIAGRFFREDAGSFNTDGFMAGDTALWYENGVYMANITINSISTDGKTLYYTLNSGSVTNGEHPYLVGITPLTSLIYSFGLIENNGNYETNNLVTNESQGFYSTGEVGDDDGMGGRLTTWVDMEGLGIPNSWESGSARVKFVNSSTGFGTTYQKFQIEHIFIIPFFRVQDLSDLQNGIAPDYLKNNQSLKYAFDVDFRTVISNPNTGKRTTYKDNLGSVGFFGETFNGFDSNYELISVDYQDSLSASLDGLIPSDTTQVTVVIEKIVGNFAANDAVGVYVAYLPQLQSEVENTITDFETNFMYDNIFCKINGLAQGGGGILDNAQAVAVGNTVTITFETTYSTAQQLRLSALSNYILAFEVGDSTKTAGNSDAVILHTVNTFDVSADIPDLITNFDMAIYPHTEYFAGGGFTDFKGWVEDGLALNGSFEIDLDLEAIINSFNIYLIAYNSTSNSYFVLDQFNIPLGSIGSATAFGYTYQIINTNTTRGYQLVSGSEKNGVSLILDVGSGGTSTPLYEFTFAQKIKWQDWLKNNDVNNIFYNALKPQNNLNFKSSNYSNIFGYKIQMMFEINMAGVNALGVSGNTDYRYFTPNLRIYDYDLDSYTTPRFTQVIETFHPTTLADLGGAILVGEDTLFKTTWTDTWGAITDITNFWGIHRIEESGGVGNIYELSSYETNELTNNLLKPISGNYLTKTLTAGKLVTTCYIDGTKLANGVNYDISARIDSPFNPKVRQPDIRVSNTGDYRVDESGNYREVI